MEYIELMLKEILKDPEKMKECNETARKIMEKRKQKVLQVKKAKGFVLNKTARLKSEYDKWKQVSLTRSKVERDDIMKKFLIINKKKICEKYVFIIVFYRIY